MIEDITPSNVGKYIHYKHGASATCKSDKRAHPLPSHNYLTGPKVAVERERLDNLASHCKHPQTHTILMHRYVENEWGVALEQSDVEQCDGCAAVLWDTSS